MVSERKAADRNDVEIHDEEHVCQKKKSPSNKTLVKDGLKSNLSAVEATSQLKVLCRKFAALTEKIKEETRIRVEAEKEVRRLKLIIEGNDCPVIASTRAETQALIKELHEEQQRLKHELKIERDKNDKLVSKALELELEKKKLMASNSIHPNTAQELSSHRASTAWDREQSQRIRDAFQATIDELQEELGRKEDEISSFREQRSYERSHLKNLEQQILERDRQDSQKQNLLKELELQLDEQREQLLSLEREMVRSNERAQYEETMRTTMEQQIETLNQVNDALEQRTRTLMKRLEMSTIILNERDELRAQLRDTEVDKETLVHSIKDLKDQYFKKETHWKCQIEQIRAEKSHLSSHISELQSDITSLRAQNALFSEWMLVRNENNTAGSTTPQQVRVHNTLERHESEVAPLHPTINGYQQQGQSAPLSAAQVRPLESSSSMGTKSGLYVHTSPRHPLSPSKTRSMTTASPVKQSRRQKDPSSSLTAIYSTKSPYYKRVTPTKRGANSCTSTRPTNESATSSAKLNDHERLRALMNRNRELQQRLQQETIATRNLEEEIMQFNPNEK